MAKKQYVALQRIESPGVSLWPGDDVPDDLPGLDEMVAWAEANPDNAAVIDKKAYTAQDEPEEGE